MQKHWLKHYPAGVPAEVRTDLYPSLLALFDESFRKHAALPAYRFLGKAISFAQLDQFSRAFAACRQRALAALYEVVISAISAWIN